MGSGRKFAQNTRTPGHAAPNPSVARRSGVRVARTRPGQPSHNPDRRPDSRDAAQRPGKAGKRPEGEGGINGGINRPALTIAKAIRITSCDKPGRDLGSSGETRAGSTPVSRTSSALECSGVLWSPLLRVLEHSEAIKTQRGVRALEGSGRSPRRPSAAKPSHKPPTHLYGETRVPRNPRKKSLGADQIRLERRLRQHIPEDTATMAVLDRREALPANTC